MVSSRTPVSNTEVFVHDCEEIIVIAPTKLLMVLVSQSSFLWQKSSENSVDFIAITSSETPINMSEKARFVSNNVFD